MEDNHPGPEFHRILETFPPSVRDSLQTIAETGGMLSVERCRAVTDTLKISAEELMMALLPLAALFSKTEISGFRVGAVAQAGMPGSERDAALFLGANIEFPEQALTQTIHAEQSAVINAWLRDARQIDGIAVTDPPCGYCRQFLYELAGRQHLQIVLLDQTGRKKTQHRLADFLPLAFGPHDLGAEAGLMASEGKPPKLRLKTSSQDPCLLAAKAAAEKSYAPYSRNLAGCVIQTTNGALYAGRYAENAAFNPSLSPLHTAIIRMTLDRPGLRGDVNRAVLVERPTAISQRGICELLLRTIAPDVDLEYYPAHDR